MFIKKEFQKGLTAISNKIGLWLFDYYNTSYGNNIVFAMQSESHYIYLRIDFIRTFDKETLETHEDYRCHYYTVRKFNGVFCYFDTVNLYSLNDICEIIKNHLCHIIGKNELKGNLMRIRGKK
ncbi:MAG: hypothetical protein IJ039_04560 [Clostridia bacterium]|nr:hypothetical protein [Clostridia bacterium]